MSDDYRLNMRKDMSLIISLGNNHAEISGDNIEFPFINTAGTDTINITTDFNKIEEENRFFLQIKPELETDGNRLYKIHLPAAWNQDITIEANNGRISLTNLNGTVKAQTTHGQIKGKDITGKVTMQCATGSIEGVNLKGIVEISTTNGKIDISGSFIENGSIKSNRGNIVLQITPVGAGNLLINSGNGEIDLALPPVGDYQVKIQTKGKFNNYLKNCAIINDKEITSLRMGDAKYQIMVINFQGGVRLMATEDIGKDWDKNETENDFQFTDPVKFFQDLFTRDYAKDIPDIMKKLSDFGSQFNKFSEDIAKKFGQLQKGSTKEDEIKIVLQMLQEGKISTEDAEKLINAIKRK